MFAYCTWFGLHTQQEPRIALGLEVHLEKLVGGDQGSRFRLSYVLVSWGGEGLHAHAARADGAFNDFPGRREGTDLVSNEAGGVGVGRCRSSVGRSVSRGEPGRGKR